MAKGKLDYSSVLAKTERPEVGQEADNSDLDEGVIKPMGVGLRTGELAALQEIVDANRGVTRNFLLRYAIRWFIVEYRAGNIDLAGDLQTEVTEVTTGRLPGSKKKATARPR